MMDWIIIRLARLEVRSAVRAIAFGRWWRDSAIRRGTDALIRKGQMSDLPVRGGDE